MNKELIERVGRALERFVDDSLDVEGAAKAAILAMETDEHGIPVAMHEALKLPLKGIDYDVVFIAKSAGKYSVRMSAGQGRTLRTGSFVLDGNALIDWIRRWADGA